MSMVICLRHGQQYPLDGWCPYCGKPDSMTVYPAATTNYPIRPRCYACDNPGSSVGHTCGLRDKLVGGN